MLPRRTLLTLPATLFAENSSAVRPLTWQQLTPAARRLAPDVGLTPQSWPTWQAGQRHATLRRVNEGTAEHVVYYLLQSRSFTGAAPLEPMRLAHESPNAMPPAVRARADAFRQAEPACERHRLLRSIWDAGAWPVDRCYQHTMAFLRAKEIDSRPLDSLYESRGLSSDTQPWSAKLLAGLGPARRILLAGPGLDLTRREKFDDNLPLVSHQLDDLRNSYPDAVIDAIDVRPEVHQKLRAHLVDATVDYLPGAYDLIIATNLLLYYPLRELLTAMAGFHAALAPGGRLVHNEQRFAAKVFGEALEMTLDRFEPKQFASRKGIEQWDRIVIHRKGEAH